MILYIRYRWALLIAQAFGGFGQCPLWAEVNRLQKLRGK